jgi:hypothetical protein
MDYRITTNIKYVLCAQSTFEKSLEKDVLRSILFGKKEGFGSPVSKWLTNDVIEEVLENSHIAIRNFLVFVQLRIAAFPCSNGTKKKKKKKHAPPCTTSKMERMPGDCATERERKNMNLITVGR